MISSVCNVSVESILNQIESHSIIASIDTYLFLQNLDLKTEIDVDFEYVKCHILEDIKIPYITGLATYIDKKYVYIHKGLNLCNS